MIHVSIVSGMDGVVQITANGHAGYARSGEDIVCSAVSALMLTAAIAIERRGGKPYIRENPASTELSLDGMPAGKHYDESLIILGAVADGLRAMQPSYAQYITIREV